MKSIFLSILCGVALLSCQNNDPKPDMSLLPEPMVSPDPPEDLQALKMGDFTSYAHNLAGRSTLYIGDMDKKILRFEEFTMNQGPDVYVFLSESNNYSKANVIPITKLTEGYNNASLQFDVDSSIDLNIHKFVLVYCVQYNSLFGYTELK